MAGMQDVLGRYLAKRKPTAGVVGPTGAKPPTIYTDASGNDVLAPAGGVRPRVPAG